MEDLAPSRCRAVNRIMIAAAPATILVSRNTLSHLLRSLTFPFILVSAVWAAPSTHAQSIVPDLEQEVRLRAAQVESKLIAWRRDIHEHPELGEQETRTSSLVASHLAQPLCLARIAPRPCCLGGASNACARR
jgi:hypothetical protein